MHVHQQRFSVSFEYPVYFVRDAFHPESGVFVDALSRAEPDRRHRVGFVVEERVAELWPDLVPAIRRLAARVPERFEIAGFATVAGGEACKEDARGSLELVAEFDRWHLDRHSVVVVIGGGALQDMAGFGAAVAHRGLRVIRMPTTVLSQNDGGVGVKNGVNAHGKKNLIGAFSPPFAVIDDFRFLDTLEARDKTAGMAEAVKVALLKDAAFFDWLDTHAERLARFEPGPLEELVRRCAVLHLDHIASGDPFELGSSRPLDFGHWAAHKIESLSRYRLRHGEAVAIGLALDCLYSTRVGLLDAQQSARAIRLLGLLGLPTWDDVLADRDGLGRRRVFEGLEEFREHLGGELTLSMLEDLGRGRDVHEVDEAVMEGCIEELASRGRAGASPSVRLSPPPLGDDARAR